jgi:ubiquitin C-terminal hydrolase
VKNDTDMLVKRSLETWKSFYKDAYSPIIEYFSGLFFTNVDCMSCKKSEQVFEPFNCLSIDIADTNLTNCIDKYFENETNITSWKCTSCKGAGCNKHTKLWSLPNYLIIQLKRFDNSRRKLNTVVDFPLDDLNLTKYVTSDKKDPNNYIYSLYAVNYHAGDLDGGHYFSCARNLDNNWYLFNDGHVSKYKEVFAKDAYLLFYYRKFIPKVM